MVLPMASTGAASDDLEAGAVAPAERTWPKARTAFERALAAGCGPKALEGLAQAAFVLNEAALALDTREAAYAGYREAGRAVDAARGAIALAWDYRAHRGERAVSDGWLARASRLLDRHGPTRERGWLALREASFSLPADAALARERCAEAEALGRELGDVNYDAMVAEMPLANMRLHLCPRAADGIVLVDTCPSREAFEAFPAGQEFHGLRAGHGLPDPERLEDFSVHVAFVDRDLRAQEALR
jgi:hypothetical protein